MMQVFMTKMGKKSQYKMQYKQGKGEQEDFYLSWRWFTHKNPTKMQAQRFDK